MRGGKRIDDDRWAEENGNGRQEGGTGKRFVRMKNDG
jgi:hypothetical protein